MISYFEPRAAAKLRHAALLLLMTSPFMAATAQAATADIVDIQERNVATGGTATLIRGAELFRINVNAVGLTPGNAYVLLLVAFNNPTSCIKDAFPHCDFTVDSNALGGDPSVTSTTLYLTGGVADSNGQAGFNGKLERGAVGLAGREVLEGTGVYNMAGAHLQVIIRDMGPWGSVDKYGQTTRRGFGCDVNTCTNVQIATFH